MARRISKDYDSELKDDLQSEANARGLTVKGTGANDAITKDDLVGALEDDDTAPAQPKPPLPPLIASRIPQLKPLPDNIPSVSGDAPKDEDYDGSYTQTSGFHVGEDFALAIVEDEPHGRTHFAKNSAHFWNGTEAEFKAQFDKN